MTSAARRRGAQLRSYRTLRGYSQERLGLEAGLGGAQTVYLIETGQRGGAVATWIALAEALQVPPLALLAVPEKPVCVDGAPPDLAGASKERR